MITYILITSVCCLANETVHHTMKINMILLILQKEANKVSPVRPHLTEQLLWDLQMLLNSVKLSQSFTTYTSTLPMDTGKKYTEYVVYV